MSKNKNITLSLPEQVLRWLKVESAKEQMSLSKYVSRLLAAQVKHDRNYEESMKQYFARGAFINNQGVPYPGRSDLYD